MRVHASQGGPASADWRKKTLAQPLRPPQTRLAESGLQFGSRATDLNTQQQRQLAREISATLKLPEASQADLLARIQQGRKLQLPKGYGLEYGFIHPDGRIESPYPKLKSMLQPAMQQAKKQGLLPQSAQPVLLPVETPQTTALLQTMIDGVLKKEFAQPYRNPKTGIVTNNVILTDLIEKLISGYADTDLPQPTIANINRRLNGQTPEFEGLRQLYRIRVPGNPDLTRTLNRSPRTRQQLLGLDLAQKIYADSQDVEWHSIALSLGLGVVGEPTINHFFKEGGTVATAIRTGLMSAIDITGNVLSVMGVVNENLKARDKTLSFETIYGPKNQRNLLKTLFNPQGEAGPDIKHGVKAGLLGGLFGVWFNVPAGGILSMPGADVASRAVIGGIGAAGSAAAIPFAIREAKENFKASIRMLIEKGQIQPPESVRKHPAKLEKYIEKMALKELNARIGMASSIKATHPVPLVGTGAVILAGEKLGIPREYVQTAYMALAPVMHNFLRLVYTGVEKFWTIPNRMRKLEKLVCDSQNEAQRKFNRQQLQQMDKAFLSGQDEWLGKLVGNFSAVITTSAILLAAEVLYFTKAMQTEKSQKQAAQPMSRPVQHSPAGSALAFKIPPYPQPAFPAPYSRTYGYLPMGTAYYASAFQNSPH